MARSYCCYRFQNDERVPLPNHLRTTQQLPLLEEEAQSEASTILQLLGDADLDAYQKFLLRHETDWDQWIRVVNREYRRVIAIHEFHMFAHKEKGRVLFDGNRVLAGDAVRRLRRDHKNQLPIESWGFDLEAIERNLQPRVTGGWFGDLRIHNVHAAAIFGPDVSLSEDWQRLEALGELRNIHIDIIIDNALYKCSISKRGSVVVFRNIPESEALFVADSLLDVLAEIESSESTA